MNQILHDYKIMVQKNIAMTLDWTLGLLAL
jgi:hypothetical protein